jgi:hypothetical protein
VTIIEEVKTAIGEENESIFWTAEHIYDALNEAHIEMNATLKNSIITVPWVVEAGDDLVEIPTEIMIPKQIEDTSRTFFITTPAKLEQESLGWRGTPAGVPGWFVLWDAFRIRVWPRADNDYQYNMVGIPWKTEFSGSYDDISTDHQLRKSLVCRAASNLMESTQPPLAASLLQQALSYEDAYRSGLRNSQPHNIRRLLPGPNKMNSAKTGVIKLGKGFTRYGL